jgi:monoamine oxidase
MGSNPSEVDIVIVGAGAAGLAAGRALRAAGASFVIVEARARAGGRGWTRVVEGFPLDLGCGWLHSAETNPFADLAADMGVDLDRSPAPWQRPAYAGNFPMREQADYRAAWAAFYDRLEAAAEAVPDRPAETCLEPGGRWNAMLNAGSTSINGVELSGLSVVDFGRYRDSGVNWRAPIGFGALMERMGEALPVQFNCAASTIDHAGARLRVETSAGPIACRAAIVTVSTNIIAQGGIRFRPDLPDKAHAAAQLPLGLADKLFLAVDGAEELPAETRLYATRDRTAMASYHWRPFGRPLVEGYFGGAFARELEHAGEAAFADFAIGEIASALGSLWRGRLRAVACSRWALDPWARGSYSHAQVGASDQRAALAAPIDGRLFFAGEACSRHDFSTAHGAFRTGVAAAQAALGDG